MTIYSNNKDNRVVPEGYYVYAYLRKDLTPYYIGKGIKYRAWSNAHGIHRPPEDWRIVIMEQGLTNLGALALERRYIRWYGRKDKESGILRNMTDGGDGVTGDSQKIKDKRIESRKRNNKPIIRKNIGEKHHLYDSTFYHWYNKNGNECDHTKLEMINLYNISRSCICYLFSGKIKTTHGWSLEPLPKKQPKPKKGRTHLHDQTLYHWRHFDGREEILSQFDMRIKHNLNKGNVNSVIHRRNGHSYINGWSIIF